MKISNNTFATLYVAFVMFLPNTIYLVNQPGLPLISFKRAFILFWLVLFFSLMLKSKSVKKQILQLPYYQGCIFFLFALGLVTAATFSTNSLSFSKFLSVVFEDIFPVFMVWVAFKDKRTLFRKVKVMVLIYGAIALYGILAYLYGYNPILDFFVVEDSSRELLFNYDDKERGGIEGRAQSFLAHPLHFGYISSLMMLFLFAFQRGGGEGECFSTKVYLILTLIFFLSILLAGSRSPVLLLMIGAFTYIILLNLYDFLKTSFIFFVSLFLFFLISISEIDNDVLGNYVFLITSIIEELVIGSSDFGGSSFDMRMSQLNVSMEYFSDKPVFGNGLAYLRVLLENKVPGLLGAESFAFKLLIELGFVGAMGYVILYGSIFFTLLRYRKSRILKKMVGATLGLLLGHLSFIFATGEMGLFYLFLILITLLLRGMFLYEQDKKG